MARDSPPTTNVSTTGRPEQRRMFIKLRTPWASPYALGPTSKGYPNTPDGHAQARRDAADQYGVDPDDVDVWAADPREYGKGA